MNIILALYAFFVVAVAAILLLSGANGRRQLLLSGFSGGTMTLLLRVLVSGYDPARITLVQIMAFPVLVLATWAALFVIGKIRS